MSRVQYLAEEVRVSYLASDDDLTQPVLDHHGKTTRCRSAVHHGRSTSLHGSDTWIPWREYGSRSFVRTIKAKQDDEPQWRVDT